MIPTKLKTALYAKKIRRAMKDKLRTNGEGQGKIGLITNAENVEDIKSLSCLPEKLGLTNTDLQIVLCDSEISSLGDLEVLHLTSKEITASGAFKSQEIKEFMTGNYELLVCYFIEKSTIGSLLAVETNARFIFGNKPDHFGIYDVEISAENIDVFQQEVMKYYRIFKAK